MRWTRGQVLFAPTVLTPCHLDVHPYNFPFLVWLAIEIFAPPPNKTWRKHWSLAAFTSNERSGYAPITTQNFKVYLPWTTEGRQGSNGPSAVLFMNRQKWLVSKEQAINAKSFDLTRSQLSYCRKPKTLHVHLLYYHNNVCKRTRGFYMFPVVMKQGGPVSCPSCFHLGVLCFFFF